MASRRLVVSGSVAKEGVLKSVGLRFGFFLFFFACGLSAIVATTQKYAGNSRDPAAVRQVYDFTNLRGENLDQALKKHALAGLEIYREQGRMGFGLGHFAFLNAAGEKTLGCKEYEKVAFRFEAEGTVVSGERPVMEVEGACRFSEDLTKVNPLYVPVTRILGEKPADGEFQFREGEPVLVRFSNLSDEWPRKWVLTGVKLSGHSDFVIDHGDIDRSLGRPFLFEL